MAETKTDDEEGETYTSLNHIREQIENMSKFNQIEILRIITNNKDITINENKNGIHINLNDIDTTVLSNIKAYIKYVNAQEKYLNIGEEEKEKYKSILSKKI
jgi:hypothetical protein